MSFGITSGNGIQHTQAYDAHRHATPPTADTDTGASPGSSDSISTGGSQGSSGLIDYQSLAGAQGAGGTGGAGGADGAQPNTQQDKDDAPKPQVSAAV